MNDFLYITAVILLLLWLIGIFAYSAGAIINILLVIAVVAILLRVIGGRRFSKRF